jgi:hypothetical protein
MIGRHLPVSTGAEAIRVLRALGAHRYVAGALHSIHALAFDALPSAYGPGLVPESVAAACDWARVTLSDAGVEADSKDPRLFRQASADELCRVLEAFWVPSAMADRAQERLLDRALELGLDVSSHAPFDEAFEDDMHPVLVDAGWELLPLTRLDPERHRGVIEAYGESILFDAARFEDESSIPPRLHLQELPALGLVELLRGVDAEGELVEPLVLWTEGDDVYQDYLLRGVLKAAKIGATAPR